MPARCPSNAPSIDGDQLPHRARNSRPRPSGGGHPVCPTSFMGRFFGEEESACQGVASRGTMTKTGERNGADVAGFEVLVGQGPECEFLTVAFPCCKSSSWQFKSYPPGLPPSRLPPFYPPALLVQVSLAWPLLGCGSLYTLRSTSPSRTLNLTAGPAGISVHWLPRPRPPVWPPRCRGGHGGSGARAEVSACPAGARLTEAHNGRCFTSATVGLRTRLSFQCAEL